MRKEIAKCADEHWWCIRNWKYPKNAYLQPRLPTKRKKNHETIFHISIWTSKPAGIPGSWPSHRRPRPCRCNLNLKLLFLLFCGNPMFVFWPDAFLCLLLPVALEERHVLERCHNLVLKNIFLFLSYEQDLSDIICHIFSVLPYSVLI